MGDYVTGYRFLSMIFIIFWFWRCSGAGLADPKGPIEKPELLRQTENISDENQGLTADMN
jgi:hypothetical protein